MKIGRNDPCHCGSGKKYKKCCLKIDSEKRTNQMLSQPAQRQIVKNITGEIFHPVRLHYQVDNMKALEDKFTKMKCMDFDEELQRWVWLYADEARRLRFKKAYSRLPKDGPIILGSLFRSKAYDNEVVFDLRSIERAAEAFAFFEKYVGRKVLRLTSYSLVYRFQQQNPANIDKNFDKLFPVGHAADKIHAQEEVRKELLDPIADDESEEALEQRRLRALQRVAGSLARPYPETDQIRIDLDKEDATNTFSSNLSICLKVAMERFNGNENVSFKDLIGL